MVCFLCSLVTPGHENCGIGTNRRGIELSMEVIFMLTAGVWLMLSSMLCSLRVSASGKSFPKPLSAAEERHYLELSAQGDLEARNILIERNLRLVAHIMKKYYSQNADQEDLISIGTIGLIKGISTFDFSKGARLATYAARCVENAILSQRLVLPLRMRKLLPQRNAGAYLQDWTTAFTSWRGTAAEKASLRR